MKKISNSSRHLSEHMLRALNRIRKPSTAGEITELLNRDLDRDESPFQAKDVAEWLRNTENIASDTVLVEGSSPKVGIIPILLAPATLDDAVALG